MLFKKEKPVPFNKTLMAESKWGGHQVYNQILQIIAGKLLLYKSNYVQNILECSISQNHFSKVIHQELTMQRDLITNKHKCTKIYINKVMDNSN